MKKLLTTVVMSVAALSFNANAALEGAKNYKFIGDTEYAGFCKAAATDNLTLFKITLNKQLGFLGSSKAQVLDKVLDKNNFQCAGMGIAEFSKQRNATTLIAFFNNEQSEEPVTPKVVFVGDKSYSGFCKAAVTDNVDLFKRSLRDKVGTLSYSAQGVLDIVLDENSIQCAGLGLKEFSEKREAKQLVEFFANSKI